MVYVDKLKTLLEDIAAARVSVKDAIDLIGHLPFNELCSANYDWHRPLRNGFSEVVFGEGKDINELIEISTHILKEGHNLLITRLDSEKAKSLRVTLGEGDYHERSRTFIVRRRAPARLCGLTVICGGTADIPVAEEAARTASFFGAEPTKFYDIGIAGLPRLLSKLPAIRAAKVVIAVAGLEGALPSVVAGLISSPVIAVPTSIGYGVSDGGRTPLFAMLTSCAEGVSVVNIDNGFGAACAAVRILRQLEVDASCEKD